MPPRFRHNKLDNNLDQEVINIYDQIDTKGLNFQDTEQIVGKFGLRTMYAKRVFIETGPNNSTVTQRHGITNLLEIVHASGVAHVRTTSYSAIPLPGTFVTSAISLQVTDTVVQVFTTANISNRYIYITLLYTKIGGG